MTPVTLAFDATDDEVQALVVLLMRARASELSERNRLRSLLGTGYLTNAQETSRKDLDLCEIRGRIASRVLDALVNAETSA